MTDGLDFLGMKTSAEMLEHSLQDNPPAVTYKEGSRVVNQIKQTTEFKEIVNQSINSAKNGIIDQSGSITFNSNTDLAGSIHGASYKISGTTGNDCSNLNVVITDIYDYDGFMSDYIDIKNPIKKFIFITGNNLAYADQLMGSIEEYDVKIIFDYNICLK